MARLRRLRDISLRTQVVTILRKDILAGRLKPGAILSERDLAQRLRVSKTPIRESLTLLDHEGLIQTLPRKGYLVSPITVQDVHNFFELRLILESAAAEMTAAKITDEQLNQLSALVPDANRDADIGERLGRNVEFHYTIAEISGNERLARLIKQLLEEMQRMIAVGYIPEEHEKVMVAFRGRDSKGAAEAMRDHICAVRDNVLRVAGPPILGHLDARVPP